MAIGQSLMLMTREILSAGSFERTSRDVEVDEVCFGGKARNMNSDVKAHRITGRGTMLSINA